MISVAMATYNGEKYIEEQLDSILNQSKPVDEIIIFDDNSTDGTLEIIRRYADSRIKVHVNDKNVGYIENFYRAITHCKWDYIFLADQDDIWGNDKVKVYLEVMDKNSAKLVSANFSLIDANSRELPLSEFTRNRFLKKVDNTGEKYLTLDFNYLIGGNVLQGATFCINKEVQKIYKEVHDSDVYHDHQLILIASKLGKVIFINEELLKYRIHNNNTIGIAKKGSGKLSELLRVPKKKPAMVKFLDKIDKVSSIQYYSYYKFLLYLRIPSIRNFIRKII